MLAVEAKAKTAKSAIWHFARAIWLEHDLARCWLAMYYTAYYDASGSEGDPTRPLVTVGLISTVQRWMKFVDEWESALRLAGVPFFHTKELVRFEWPFDKWRSTPQEADKLLAALVIVMKRWINKVIVVETQQADFLAVSQRYEMSKVGSAYPITAGSCFGRVRDWMRSAHASGELEHIFEQGDNGQELFQQLIQAEGYAPKFEPKVNKHSGVVFQPFQAADLFAFQWRQAFKEGDSYKPPLIMRWLAHIPQEIHYHDQQSLTAMCERYPLAFPKRA